MIDPAILNDPLVNDSRLLRPDIKAALAVMSARIKRVQAERLTAGRTEWPSWLRECFPGFFSAAFAPHQQMFWEHIWSIKPEVRPKPFLAVWPRGGGKSSSLEVSTIMMGVHGQRHYALYVSSTQDQADKHVESIAGLLESSAFAARYPTFANRRLGKYGHSRGWRRNRLYTEPGFMIDAAGLDRAVRGIKAEQVRPDVICHEIGTPIFSEGCWMLVQQHPTAEMVEKSGFSIKIWGVPFQEVVTPEHRYWARRVFWKRISSSTGATKIIREDAQWTEAQSLTTKHYIGLPIDYTVESPAPLDFYHPTILRDIKGRVIRAEPTRELRVPEEFYDPEWWWLFGLWWGDGHVTSRQIGITVSNKQLHYVDRIRALLSRYHRHCSIVQKSGCVQVIFSYWVIGRWLKSWCRGIAQKTPPVWIEKLDFALQRAFVQGYIDADGYIDTDEDQIRITSVHLDGLLCLRRILARLSVPSSIRLGPSARMEWFGGNASWAKQKYDLRFRDGAELLGYAIRPQTRYKMQRVFIADGHLWSRVRETHSTGRRTFVPIQTPTRDYLTAFGRSHNCFDDVDDLLDSPATVAKKIKVLTRSILPAGSTDVAIIGVQNLIHEGSIFTMLATHKTDFLLDHIMSGPIPAVRDLEYVLDTDGTYEIIAGEPTWEGQNLDQCQALIDDIGLSAFLIESQHNVEDTKGGIYEHIEFQHCDWSDVPTLERIVVWVDPAVTNTDDSDAHGIQADGIANGKLYRLFSWEGRTSPEEALTRAIQKAMELKAECVGVETDQGGDTWKSVYDQTLRAMNLFDGHSVKPGVPSFRSAKAGAGHGPKAHRQAQMLSAYERGEIVHVRGTHSVLERGLRRFGVRKPYDLADACYYSWWDLCGRRRWAPVGD